MTVREITYTVRVSRWEPDARGRLERAAMELFRERGYAKVTVAEIAERAGVTERTFFRYFADKREVLFGRGKDLEKALVDWIAAAPAELAPLDVVVAALESIGPVFDPRHPHSRQRQQVIDEHPELQERELIKLATLAAAMAASLRHRGIGEPTASLAAEAGMGIFKVAFTRWVGDAKPPKLAAIIRALRAQLVSVVTTKPAARKRSRATRREHV